MSSNIFDNSRSVRSVHINLSQDDFSGGHKKLEYSSEAPIITNISPILKLEDKTIHYRCPRCFNFPKIDFIKDNEEFIRIYNIYMCLPCKEKNCYQWFI